MFSPLNINTIGLRLNLLPGKDPVQIIIISSFYLEFIWNPSGGRVRAIWVHETVTEANIFLFRRGPVKVQ